MLPNIIQEAIKGISEHIPTIIDQHLSRRGAISINGSYDDVDNDYLNRDETPRDTGTQSNNRDAGVHSMTNRDAGAQSLINGDAGAQLVGNRDIGAQRNIQGGEQISTCIQNDEQKSITSQKSFDNVQGLVRSSRKRPLEGERSSTPPLIISEEILNRLDDELGLDDKVGKEINAKLAK